MQTNPIKFFKKLGGLWAFIFLVGFISSCDDKATAPKPIADFSYVVDATDGVTVTFTNKSTNATTYSWAFGDASTASTDASPVYKYLASGSFTVVLTATSSDGSKATKQSTLAIVKIPQNVLLNGGFDNSSSWIIHDTPSQANGDATDFTYGNIWTFADSKLIISGNYVSPGGGPSRTSGTIYQAVQLEAGTYQLSGEFFGTGFGDAWMWIQLQKNAPVVNEFPSEGGDFPLMGADLGGCANFDADIKLFSCGQWDDFTNSTATAVIATAGTYYFVLSAGQWESTYGTVVGFKSIALKKIL